MLLQMTLFHYFLWLILHIIIHCCVDGHLVCFHNLFIVNSASVNIGVHVCFQDTVFYFFLEVFSKPQWEVPLFCFLKCSLWISATHLYSMLKSFIFSPEVGLFWHEEIFRSLLFKPEHGHNAQPGSLVNTCQVSVHASPLRIQRMNEKLGMCL